MPVPKVRKTMFRASPPRPRTATRPARTRWRRSAGKTRQPSAFSSSSTIGTRSHPGRFGGDRSTPPLLSSGPPQLTPTAAGLPGRVPPWRRARASSPIASTVARQEPVPRLRREDAPADDPQPARVQRCQRRPPSSFPRYRPRRAARMLQTMSAECSIHLRQGTIAAIA